MCLVKVLRIFKGVYIKANITQFFKSHYMNKVSKFIIITVTITTISFLSCAKKQSSKLPPPANCDNPSDCIVNTWYIQTWQANYNGSVISVYARGGNSNLSNFDSVSWVFESSNKWVGYSSPSVIFDAGTWVILPDNKTVEISSTASDTFTINSITPSALSINIPFDHNYPNTGSVVIALNSGLDTAKLSAFIGIFSPNQ
jgi:hypothetical protein